MPAAWKLSGLQGQFRGRPSFFMRKAFPCQEYRLPVPNCLLSGNTSQNHPFPHGIPERARELSQGNVIDRSQYNVRINVCPVILCPNGQSLCENQVQLP